MVCAFRDERLKRDEEEYFDQVEWWTECVFVGCTDEFESFVGEKSEEFVYCVICDHRVRLIEQCNQDVEKYYSQI